MIQPVLGGRGQMGVGLAVARGYGLGGGQWWDNDGAIAGCVAAYQAKGAASLAASYVNLANPGVYDLSAGVAPSWSSGVGWTFNGSTHYLDTGYVPVGTARSFMFRFDNLSAGARGTGCIITGHRFYILPASTGNIKFANSSSEASSSPGITTGVLGVNDDYGYRNGSQDVALGTAFGTMSYSFWVGAVNNGSGGMTFFQGDIIALAMYDVSLSGTDVATITSAMQAL